MPKLSSLKLDREAADRGIPMDFEGITLRIRRMPNPEYEAELRRLGKPHIRTIRRARFSDAELDNPTMVEIQKRAMGKHVLVGWSNLQDDNGDEIPFTTERAIEFLLDPDMDELYRFVFDAANEASLFRAKDQASAEGNFGDT
jgi:hypothetical protein